MDIYLHIRSSQMRTWFYLIFFSWQKEPSWLKNTCIWHTESQLFYYKSLFKVDLSKLKLSLASRKIELDWLIINFSLPTKLFLFWLCLMKIMLDSIILEKKNFFLTSGCVEQIKVSSKKFCFSYLCSGKTFSRPKYTPDNRQLKGTGSWREYYALLSLSTVCSLMENVQNVCQTNCNSISFTSSCSINGSVFGSLNHFHAIGVIYQN